MNLVVSEQLAEFFYSGILGVLIGVLYDVLAIIRSYITLNKVINMVFDILFWIFAVILLFAFLLTFTEGVLRWYVLLGNFLGIFLYKNTISPLFFWFVRIIIKMAATGARAIFAPLYKLCKIGSEKDDAKKKEKAKAQS